MLHDLTDVAVRIRALDVTAERFASWHTAQRAKLPGPHEVAARIGALSDPDAAALTKLLDNLPGPDDLAHIEAAIASLGEIKPLTTEDREYVAVATVDLHRGLSLAQCGHHIDAYRALERGHQRIRWLVYERKRNSDALHRSLNPQIKMLFEAWLGEMTAVMTVANRAAKAVGR